MAVCGALASSWLMLAATTLEEGVLLFAIQAAIGLGFALAPYVAAFLVYSALGRERPWRDGITAGLAVYACVDVWVKFHSFFRFTSSTDVIAGVLVPVVSPVIVGGSALVWAVASFLIRSIRR